MIKIRPIVELSFDCPSCNVKVSASSLMITGMHTLCEGVCDNCGERYYLEAPINAGLFYPGIIRASTGLRCDDLPFNNWYLSGLEVAFKNRIDKEVSFSIEKKNEPGAKKICILTTIDATYGHSLYELFNSSFYLQQPDIHLIVIIQKNMRWLVPDSVPEIWTLDLAFSDANLWNDWIVRRIQNQLAFYKEVYLCRSFVHADSNDFKIEDYTRIKPFPLDEWDERLIKPTVTFIWRGDRFWKRVLPKIIDNRVTKKLFPSGLIYLRKKIQFSWIIKFSERLKKEIPEVDFAVAGMDDRSFALPNWIKDFRFEKHAEESALQQCQRYADSHLVLGCNGSSLLLPGCLSGAVLNIVPGDQWAVSAGTFAFRITSIGDTHFRYTMLPPETKIDRVAKTIVSMLRDRSYILLQTSPPWRDHRNELNNFDWKKFRVHAYLLKEHFTSSSGLISVEKKK